MAQAREWKVSQQTTPPQNGLKKQKKAKQELGIDEGDIKGEKTAVKHRVNNKIKEWFKERIEKEGKNKSKVQHLLEGIKKLGTPKEGQQYEKTNKAPGQHHLQSQINNAPNK